jgi:hypothetical protein
LEFSYEENERKGYYGLDCLQKGCGIEMVPKSCDDEVNLLNGLGALRIVHIVAEIW